MAAGDCLAIFVGGKSRRMGQPKGSLVAPGSQETLLERQLRLGSELGVPVVLVGAGYEDVPGARVYDDPDLVGPLGGLLGLFRSPPAERVLTLAVDMPYVDLPTLRRLRDHPDPGPALVPFDPAVGRFQPFFARYRPHRLRPLLEEAARSGTDSFQRWLSTLRPSLVHRWVMDDELRRTLRDWDTPEDIKAD